MYNNYGWICPKCGRVWAPWVMSCICNLDIGIQKPPTPYIPIPTNPWIPAPIYSPTYSTGDPMPPPNYTTCTEMEKTGE